MLSFEQLNLIEPILEAVKAEGYTNPTPIQEQSIPVLLEGKDLLGCAQTGTGKTAAFAIPILQLLYNKKDTLLNIKDIVVREHDKFSIRKAKVIKNQFNTKENYLTLNIGAKDSVKTDMGVMNDKGIVGIVERTSKNFSTVLSVLNTKSRINAKIKNAYTPSLL